MAVKTITITESAYNSLKSLKGEHESFSDVIGRMTRKRPLMDCFGILSKEEADSLENAIKEGRKIDRKMEAEKNRRLWGK